MIRVGGKFGPEQPYPDYFPTAANKENEAAAFVFRDVKKKKTKKKPLQSWMSAAASRECIHAKSKHIHVFAHNAPSLAYKCCGAECVW